MDPTTIGLITLGITQVCHLVWNIHKTVKSRELKSKCCGAEIEYKSDHVPQAADKEADKEENAQPTTGINIDKSTE